MVIRRSDRIARILDRDEALIDVLVGASPHFERLKQPAMRQVMARLVTVEQAARIAGLDPEDLVTRLNDAGHTAENEAAAAAPPIMREQMEITETVPESLSHLDPGQIVDLDVREDLRNGQEPFSRIMAAKIALEAGQVLRLRATFEPVPLYRVMAQQGFAYWTEQLGEEDWRVWFHREGDGAAASEAKAGSRAQPPAREPASTEENEPTGDGEVVILDVRGLEPPEPMVRTLAALETLPRGATLLQINVRVPQFLIPRLEKLGFEYEIRQQKEDLVRVFIRHGESR